MSVQRRCPGCRDFYDKKQGACPKCGEPAAKLNTWLATAKLNNHLYQQAARAG